MMTDFANITGYYDECRPQTEREPRKLGDILSGEVEYRRWPVRNNAEREPISSHKRAIIHERDGGQCVYCNRRDVMLVVDHIVPRSAFHEWQLEIADRSDNLQSACWDCNADRSNWETPAIKRLGVTPACWHCINDTDESIPTLNSHPVFCGRCGISQVPEIGGWVL